MLLDYLIRETVNLSWGGYGCFLELHNVNSVFLLHRSFLDSSISTILLKKSDSKVQCNMSYSTLTITSWRTALVLSFILSNSSMQQIPLSLNTRAPLLIGTVCGTIVRNHVQETKNGTKYYVPMLLLSTYGDHHQLNFHKQAKTFLSGARPETPPPPLQEEPPYKKEGGACHTYQRLIKQFCYLLGCSASKGPQWELSGTF